MVDCQNGIYDCNFSGLPADEVCAPYNQEYSDVQGNNLMIALGWIVMAMMAFGIGANDMANSWGTTVGSKALNVRTACLIGGLADWLGAVTLGYGVSSTIQKGVADIESPDCWACGYCDSKMNEYGAGMFGALFGAAVFLLLATFTAMPVSTTHAIVGGVVGMTIAGVGADCLDWSWDNGLSKIVASWVISPILSGVIGVIIFYITEYGVFRTSSPRKMALLFMPLIYFVALFFVLFMTMLKAKPTKKWKKWNMVMIAGGAALVIAIIVQLVLVPMVKKQLPSNDPNKETEYKAENADHDRKSIDELRLSDANKESLKIMVEDEVMTEEERDAQYVFRYAIILVATLESYAHGTNDTGNATGAFSAMYSIWDNGLDTCDSMETPVWIMAIAGFCVFLGVNLMGHRVIKTVGSDISLVSMHRGFCMELASTITVVIATIIKVPVSTTHCQVGAVVFVSLAAFGKDKVQFGLLAKIVASWVLTIPAAGAIAAVVLEIVKVMLKN